MTQASLTARPAIRFPLAVIIASGCVLAMISFGVRASAGLFTIPITDSNGFGRDVYGLAFAIQNLVWGLTQPISGGLADRYGSAKVIAVGGVIYAIGTLGMALFSGAGLFTLFAGVISGVGIATAAFAIVMAAFGRAVPPEKRPLVFGIATAASSAGQFVFAPLGQALINAVGWQTTLIYFSLILLLIIPLSIPLQGKAEDPESQSPILPAWTAFKRAFAHRSYVFLVLGFFTCGFHLAFVTVHMPAYLVECGLSPTVGSWALGLIGLFNIIGSLGSGWLASRMPKQILLASIYLSRAIVTALFLLLPVTEFTAYTFAAVTGLLWLATVPPTASLVSNFFGPRYLGMFYGTAFLSHQVGSFFGVWLGGVVFSMTGGYDLVWYLGILLGLASAAIHLPINDLKVANFERPVTAPAQ